MTLTRVSFRLLTFLHTRLSTRQQLFRQQNHTVCTARCLDKRGESVANYCFLRRYRDSSTSLPRSYYAQQAFTTLCITLNSQHHARITLELRPLRLYRDQSDRVACK